MAIEQRFGSTTLRNLVHMRTADAGIPIIFGAKMSATDGTCIKISDLPDSEKPELRLMAEVACYHEAEHIRVLKDLNASGWFGNNSPSILTINKKFAEQFPAQYRGLAASVLNVFEDCRIDNRANDRYPGTTEKYRDVMDDLWVKGRANFNKMGPVDKTLFMLIFKNRDLYYKEHLLDPINPMLSAEDETLFTQTLSPFLTRCGTGSFDL